MIRDHDIPPAARQIVRQSHALRGYLCAVLIGMAVCAAWVAVTTDSAYTDLAIGLVLAALLLLRTGR